MDSSQHIAANQGNEMSKQDRVVTTWIGQDGNNWRELQVWVGNGFRYFVQREISAGVWA